MNKLIKTVYRLSAILLYIFFILTSNACYSNSNNKLLKKSESPIQGNVIFINARVYTANAKRDIAEAVVINNGTISYVGSSSQAKQQAGERTTIIDVKGAMLLPGFHDVHLHAVEAGINETFCYFESDISIVKFKRELKACAKDIPSNQWVVGAGISSFTLMDWSMPPIEVADSVLGSRPMVIVDDVGHAAFSNSAGMSAVGYTLQTQPQGGVIVLDPVSKKMNGIVLENAQQKLRDAAFPQTADNLRLGLNSLLAAQKKLNALGITSISDAGGYWTRADQQAWISAEQKGLLTLRASNALYLYPDKPMASQINTLKQLYSNQAGKLLRFNQVKIYVDGILSQGTGLVNSPYQQDFNMAGVSNTGFRYFKDNDLYAYAQQLSQLGFQLHFHTTGDKAAHLALNAIEYAQQKNKHLDARHRITHLYLIDKKDIPRFKTLNVIADLQLAPSSVDAENIAIMNDVIGATRTNNLMPINSLLQAGARVTLSSDWDADELSPFVKMKTALLRAKEGAQGVPDIETAIELMTINPAYLLQQEKITGSIEVGKKADIIIVDQDLLTTPIKQLDNTHVLLTLLEGKEVYRHADF